MSVLQRCPSYRDFTGLIVLFFSVGGRTREKSFYALFNYGRPDDTSEKNWKGSDKRRMAFYELNYSTRSVFNRSVLKRSISRFGFETERIRSRTCIFVSFNVFTSALFLVLIFWFRSRISKSKRPPGLVLKSRS